MSTKKRNLTKQTIEISKEPSVPTEKEVKGQNIQAVELNDVRHDVEDAENRSELIYLDNRLTQQMNAVQTQMAQLRAVISSAEQTLHQLESQMQNINSLIPSEATEDNQLADKDFVNSSVATNTANLITNNGQPFTSVEELEAYSDTLTNNDYAYVTGTDSSGNTFYDRYKYNGSTQQWGYEFRLNNSSFTAEQWSTINSGLNENSFKTINEQSILGEGDITIESDKGVEVTQEEYDELPEEEKANGTVYYCKDGLPQDIRIIDDSVVQEETTYSSELIESKLNAIKNSIPITWSEGHVKTNEVFFDGKPIYRTCKHFAKNGLVIYDNKWVTAMTTLGNIDYLVKLFVAIKTDATDVYGITDFRLFGSANPTSRLLVKDKTISLAYSSSSSDHSYTFPYECVLVAEYTVR